MNSYINIYKFITYISFIFYVIFIFYIFFCSFSESNKAVYVENCTWNRIPHLFKYTKRYIEYYNYILNIIDKLHIVYYIQYGSSLGAVRNGGFIPNDHDMDIAIPIWKNYHIFRCKEIIKINCYKYKMNNCFLYNGYKLCGKNRTEYLFILKKLLLQYLDGFSIYTIKRSVVINNNKVKIDLTIYLGNEGSNYEVKICKTSFSGITVYSTQNAFLYLYLDYGKSFLNVNYKETMPRLYLYNVDGPIYSYEVYLTSLENKSMIIETKNITEARIEAYKSRTWSIWCKTNSKAILC